MKIKEGFVLRRVMGNYVAVAVGETSKSFRGMVKLNATAADIWQLVENGYDEEKIVESMLEKYDVEKELLVSDVRTSLEMLEKNGFLEI